MGEITKNELSIEPVSNNQHNQGDDKLRQEFNQWASDGRGEEMESHHISIAEQTIAKMNLQAGDRVLDLGCGAGWATRILAKSVTGKRGEQEGHAVGIDVADEMIARARAGSKDVGNAVFVWGSAAEIPWQDRYFDKVLSIESFYYYPDQEKVLDDVRRVMADGGELFILINLYRENHYSLRWVGELKVAVHARGEQEYKEMLERHGFRDVKIEHVPDLTPSPDEYSGKWFKSAEELKDFKRIGALLLIATKA
jgi:ubiquinone/menaquinone biosynthesis C-methylase UbiE